MNAILWQDEWQAFTPSGWETRSEGLVIADGHFEPLGLGPMLPEPDPKLFEDDHLSELADDWRAEAREWLEEFREECRDL